MESDIVLLARIIEHTPVGIVILNPDRTIHYVNTIAMHLLNSERDKLRYASIDPFMVDRQGSLPWRELWASVMQGNTHEEKIGIARLDGEEVTCTLNAFCMAGREGAQNAGALILRDITQELKIGEQLEKRNVEMAKMNAELIRSNVDLRRVSELKSNFMSIASHELKTPLTSIKGYSDIIIDSMKSRVDDGVYRMIESINRAADRLHRVINNILDVTRIEQKKLNLKPEQFDLALAAHEAVEELSQFVAKRHMAITEKYPGAAPFFGDRMRMTQVFSNLLTNAMKFSPDGSGIELAIELENGGQYHVMVIDHGIGIDKSEQKRIFDPFYEVGEISKHSTDRTKFMGGGMGLGLSIAKGIVERHGGRIWAESPGVMDNGFPGSVFHVVIPLQAAGRIEEPAVTAEQAAALRPPGGGDGKPSILIIDSDREVTEVTRMVLENAFDIIATSSGEEGLALAFQYRPAVILLDDLLPGLDGFRICRILRSQDETRSTPIVFISAITSRAEIEKCFAAGADDFLVKPFNSRELFDKVWRLLLKKNEEASD